jgi:pSer/pThr/pTyr-binding forkhead associated (FHA) protein
MATYADTTIEMGPNRPALHMGRGTENEFVVPDPMASRVHARIEYRRDRFILIDQSLNGTFVQMLGAAEVALRRDEIVLEKSGLISLGKSVAEQRDMCLRFTVQRGSQVADRSMMRKRAVR